jgi:hypothetical protein
LLLNCGLKAKVKKSNKGSEKFEMNKSTDVVASQLHSKAFQQEGGNLEGIRKAR